jgi:hypothetical protein
LGLGACLIELRGQLGRPGGQLVGFGLGRLPALGHLFEVGPRRLQRASQVLRCLGLVLGGGKLPDQIALAPSSNVSAAWCVAACSTKPRISKGLGPISGWTAADRSGALPRMAHALLIAVFLAVLALEIWWFNRF